MIVAGSAAVAALLNAGPACAALSDEALHAPHLIEDLTPEAPELPPRPPIESDYVRPPMESQNLVPDVVP